MKGILSFRFALASLVLAIFISYDRMTAMLLAGIVLTFPSWKYFAGRLAIGEQDTPELLAIKEVQKTVADWTKQLGDKASKTDLTAINDALDALKKDHVLTDTEAKAAVKTINEALEKMSKQVADTNEELKQAKENKGKARKGLELFQTADVKKFCDDTFKDGQKTHNAATLVLNGARIFASKAAEIMGYPDFFSGDGAATIESISVFTGRFVDPTLYQRKRKKNFILDNMPIETIDVPFLYYMEKNEVAGDNSSQEDVGGAAWILPGQQKPMRSFRVSVKKVERKKIAIFGTVHDEILRDVPSMENWIREDFTDEIREEYNDGLLNNDPGIDDTAPLGLKTNAIQYADTPAFNNTIPEANEIDAVIAAIAYMASLKEEPSLAVVSAAMYYKFFVLKDNESRYQNSNLVYTNSLGQLYVAGVPLIAADEEDIPSTHLLLIGVNGFKIKNQGPLVFERGLNGEDFRFDRTSFRAYQYVLSYIPQSRYNSVLYDTFANIIAAINV